MVTIGTVALLALAPWDVILLKVANASRFIVVVAVIFCDGTWAM
jgi:hypothetical protein